MTTTTKTFSAQSQLPAPVGFRDFRREVCRRLVLAGFPLRDDRAVIDAWLAGASIRQCVADHLASAADIVSR